MTYQPLSRLALAVGAIALGVTLAAQTQELIAVDFAGQAFGISPTGQKRALGPTGVTGCNAMASRQGVLFISAQNGNVHQLATLDPITALATVVVPDIGVDLRGLDANPVVGAGIPELLGIVNTATNADVLVGIDANTFQVTTIGPTGRFGIQSLKAEGSTIWAWDVNAGLLKLNRTTGQATDPFPFIGTLGANIQYLTIDHQNRLVGGNSALYEIDRDTGIPHLLGSDGFVDLRGAARHRGRLTPFGAGCSGAPGGFGTNLVAGSDAMPGSSVGFASTNHQPNRSGVLLIGQAQQAIPFVGSTCLQLVQADTSIAMFSGPAGFVKSSFRLPAAFGITLHMQLVMFEDVPGGIVATHGLTIEVPQ